MNFGSMYFGVCVKSSNLLVGDLSIMEYISRIKPTVCEIYNYRTFHAV